MSPLSQTIAAIEADYDGRVRTAAAQEELRRDAALIDAPYTIAGLPIRVMTIVDYLVLIVASNAHVAHALAPVERVEELAWWAKHDEEALWLLSPEFSRHPAAREIFFRDKLAKLDAPIVHAELVDYFAEMFVDAPRAAPGGSGDLIDPVRVSFAAWWLRDVARVVPWSRSELRSLPLPEFFQYLRIARAERAWKKGKKPPPVTDETDRLISEKLGVINGVLAEHKKEKKGAA